MADGGGLGVGVAASLLHEVRLGQTAIGVEFIEEVVGDVGEDESGDVVLVQAGVQGLDGVDGGVGDVETEVEGHRDVIEDLSRGDVVLHNKRIVECVSEPEADEDHVALLHLLDGRSGGMGRDDLRKLRWHRGRGACDGFGFLSVGLGGGLLWRRGCWRRRFRGVDFK